MNRSVIIFGLIILVFLAGLSLAGIPKMINYQGMLTDNSGTPLSGPYNLTFKIWTDTTGGSSLWDETHAVSVQNGLYNVILGWMTALNLPFDQQYWLEVKVGDETMPRIRFTSVGYAYRAQNADTAEYARGGGGGSGSPWIFRISDGSDTTITSGGGWGVARFGNVLFGNADSTHVNLGVACTTGTSGQNYKYCTVGGGNNNTASGRGATIGGGLKNTASGSSYPTVGGGQNNTASASLSTISGGGYNSVSGGDATVGGGYGDTITAGGSYATISGGAYNTASGSYAAIGGGYTNSVTTNYSGTIAGGWENITSGSYASIGGGSQNNTAGDYSAIPGGKNDTLSSLADYSMAFGVNVYVNNPCTVIFFDSTYDGCLQINRDHHDATAGSYPIRVGTSPANGNGAYLTKGGAWTNGSSRSKKENFEELDGAGILDKIENMPVTRWNFKGMEERHISPVAEDFYRAFGCGTGITEDDSTYISAMDIAGVSLVAIQELSQMVKEQQKEIEALKEQIKTLQVR